jgi:hypothetical protein
MMTIELNFHDLMRLAANTEVVKDGVTIKINPPVFPGVNVPAKEGDEFAVFSLDSSDPRSEEFKWNANIQR